MSYKLIVTIVNRGFCEDVMEAARGAGARGGTVFNARGTGSVPHTIFGMIIEPEKEVVWIVAKTEQCKDIMLAIYEKAGLKTPGSGIIFALPVDDVIGLTPMQAEEIKSIVEQHENGEKKD